MLNPLTLTSNDPNFEAVFLKKIRWSDETEGLVSNQVDQILKNVASQGDPAVLEYTRQFDQVTPKTMADLTLSAKDFKDAFDSLPAQEKNALQLAADRIQDFHEKQKQSCGQSWHFQDEHGAIFGQKVLPLDSVGIYVPGGKAAYPSSVLMNAIPARVAGVKEIIMVVPTPMGVKNPMVLAAAHVAGVNLAFTIGGAQAIAALAYGTQTIPSVDKITGPGNAYVAEAKRRVFGKVGIDMIAGPSEILIIADGSTPAQWVAMDLFSQAEHDELAQSILITPDAHYLVEVKAEMSRLLPTMRRSAIIKKSINDRGLMVHCQDMHEACELANKIAPEHLEVSCQDPHKWEPLLKHAGAIFLGSYASESLGDYVAGPNHVLPTSGTARFSNPLGVYDFQKRTSILDIPLKASQYLASVAFTLAQSEGLQAHALSAALRQKSDTL